MASRLADLSQASEASPISLPRPRGARPNKTNASRIKQYQVFPNIQVCKPNMSSSRHLRETTNY